MGRCSEERQRGRPSDTYYLREYIYLIIIFFKLTQLTHLDIYKGIFKNDKIGKSARVNSGIMNPEVSAYLLIYSVDRSPLKQGS